MNHLQEVPMALSTNNPSIERVFSAFQNVDRSMSDISKTFNLQEFLRSRSVKINELTFHHSSWRMFQACAPIALRDAFNGDMESFGLFERLFGSGEDWVTNWSSIAEDILQLEHFLEYRDYYLEKSRTSFLLENLKLEMLVADETITTENVIDLENNQSVEALVLDLLMKGNAQVGSKVMVTPDSNCQYRVSSESRFIPCDKIEKWGIAKYQGKLVDLSDFDKLYELKGTLSHIQLPMVQLILKEFFVPNGFAVFEQADGSYKLRLDITRGASDLKCLLLTSYTQNGKTNQMIALCWILFFCHGYGSYGLCRSDAQEYQVLKKAINAFNDNLSKWAKTCVQFQGNINMFKMEPLALPDCTKPQLKKIEVMNEDTQQLRCIFRIRILQSSNTMRAMEEIEYMNKSMLQFGYVDVEQRRHKFAVIIDEAQNIFQSLNQTQKIQLTIHQLLQTVGICIEVSATPEASFVMKSNNIVELMLIPTKPDYYGYSAKLSESKRIPIWGIEDYFDRHTTSTTDSLKDMREYGVKGLVDMVMKEECVRPRHWLCVVGSGSNVDMEAMGNDILIQLKHHCYNQPVIIVLAVASTMATSSIEGEWKSGGAIILFNNIAAAAGRGQKILTKDLINHIDKEFYISPNDADTLTDYERRIFECTKNGSDVKDHNGERKTKLPKRCSTDNVILTDNENDFSIKRLCLPRVGGYYRLRTQLSMVERLMQELGFGEKYTVITLGSRLIREGITPKTQNHTLAPEKMFCLYPRKGFEKRTVVALTQTMGRLCGTRSDGILPTLYIRSDCLNMFRKVIEFNENAIHYVNKYQHGRTVEYILGRNLGDEDHPTNPIIKGFSSASFVCNFDSSVLPQSIIEMRKWFSVDPQEGSLIDLDFERKKVLVLMLLQLSNELVVVDQMDEWSYEEDFLQEKHTAIRSILCRLSHSRNVADVWIDTSLSDEASKFPVGIRPFQNKSVPKYVIRLNEIGCRNDGIRNGLVYCTCNPICQGFVDSISFNRCSGCHLHCHVACQPLMNSLCSRCLAPSVPANLSYEESSQEMETDTTESDNDDSDFEDSLKSRKRCRR